MGTQCGSCTPQKQGWCSKQIFQNLRGVETTTSCHGDRTSRLFTKTAPFPNRSRRSRSFSHTRSVSLRGHSHSSRHKLDKHTNEAFGLKNRAPFLDSTHTAMRGLAVLRALNAAVAFEGHVMGRGAYATWTVSPGTAVVSHEHPKHSQEVTRSSVAVCKALSREDTASPGASDLENTLIGDVQKGEGEPEDGYSQGTETGFPAESSKPPSNASSTGRPLPPLSIVQQLLTASGGPASLPLFKNGWPSGNNSQPGLEESTSVPLDSSPSEHRRSVQSLLTPEGILPTNSISAPSDSPFQTSKAALLPVRPPKLPRPEELLDLNPKMLEFFRQRGVSEQTLTRNGVRMQVAYSPKEKREVPAIMFPYLRDGRLVNAKYRTLDKQYWQIKGAEQSLYGIDDVVGSETVIIVEGEMDKLAMEEAGYTNCVSVPGGAPNNLRDQELPPPNPVDDRPFGYLWTCQQQLSKASKFVLATDADRPGLVLSEELARRLGRERCWQVNWPVTPDGQRVKDANEALLTFGKEGIRAAIEAARAFPTLEAVETELELSAEPSKQTEDGLLSPSRISLDDRDPPGSGLLGGPQGGFSGSGANGVGAVVGDGAGFSERERVARDVGERRSSHTGSAEGLKNGQTPILSVGASESGSRDGSGVDLSSGKGDRGSQTGWNTEMGAKHAGGSTQRAHLERPTLSWEDTQAAAESLNVKPGFGVKSLFRSEPESCMNGLGGSGLGYSANGLLGRETGYGVNGFLGSESEDSLNALLGAELRCDVSEIPWHGSGYGVNGFVGSDLGASVNRLSGTTQLWQAFPSSATAHGGAVRSIWRAGYFHAGASERRRVFWGCSDGASMQSARHMSTGSCEAVSWSQSGAMDGSARGKADREPGKTTSQRAAAFLNWEKGAGRQGGSGLSGGARISDPWLGGHTPPGKFLTEEAELAVRSKNREGQVACQSWRGSRGEAETGGPRRGETGPSKGPTVRKVGLRRSRDAGTAKEAGRTPRLLTDMFQRQEPERGQPGVAKTVSETGNAQVRSLNGKMGAFGSSPGMHVAAGARQAATAAPVMTDLIRKTAELSVRGKGAAPQTASNLQVEQVPPGSKSNRTSETGSSAASDPAVSEVSPVGSDLRSVTAFERTEVTIVEYAPAEALSAEVDSDVPDSPAAAGLNNEQLAAVFAPVGPVRVVAGPGSGKTKVLTNRVAHLVLDRGMRPWNILCITFTNKAASEMRERVGKMLDDVKANGPAVGTFHGICARILRKSVEGIPDCGRTSTYVIYDEADSITLLRQIIKSVPGLDVKSVKFRELLSKLANEKLWRLKLEIKTQLGIPLGGAVVPLAASGADSGDEPPIRMDPIVQLMAAQYEAELRKCNAFDFSDLLIWSVRLLRSCPSVLQDYRKLWRHLLVDEFQDTDFAQYELVRLLGKEHQSVFVVGDLDQSIYGWRGADFRNMQTLFERDFPGGQVYQLRKNYRSTRTILEAAEALITRSEVSRTIGKHKPLQLDPIKPFGRQITFLESETDRQEATQVVTHVRHMVDAQGHSWGDMAVLYRTNMQSRLFQEELTKKGIPFLVLGGLSFYARKEIKDIISYLKLIANPLDEVALNRVLNVPPRGIGPKAMEKLQHWAASLKMTLPEALYEHRKELPEELVLVGKAKTGIRKFVLLLDHLFTMSQTESLDVLIREILQRTEYQKYIAETKSESNEEKTERWQHILDLRHVAQEHARKNGEGATALAAFLEDVALVAAVDEEGIEGGAGKSAQAAKPVVKLMTIHASKGLEFPCVFLVGLEEGLLPTSRAAGVKTLVAEERRLCYVAITRAKDRLFLSRAETRYRNGEVLFQKPSRFWTEIS